MILTTNPAFTLERVEVNAVPVQNEQDGTQGYEFHLVELEAQTKKSEPIAGFPTNPSLEQLLDFLRFLRELSTVNKRNITLTGDLDPTLERRIKALWSSSLC